MSGVTVLVGGGSGATLLIDLDFKVEIFLGEGVEIFFCK